MAVITKPSEILAANIRRELEAREWRYLDLSDKTGLAVQKISQILRAKYDIRLGTVDKIARAFDVPISTLLSTPREES